MEIKVETKEAKREFFKIRARFAKLQRSVIGEALEFAAVPVVFAARNNAPVLTGLLRERIRFTKATNIKGRLRVDIGPIKFRRNEKGFPFYGLFQERGFRAMGRANRKTFKRATAVPGRQFLRRAGEQNVGQVENIFARRVFDGFRQIQAAGESVGLV